MLTEVMKEFKERANERPKAIEDLGNNPNRGNLQRIKGNFKLHSNVIQEAMSLNHKIAKELVQIAKRMRKAITIELKGLI